VLGLDLAKSYGWAYIAPDGGYVASGKRILRGVDRGTMAHELQMSIADLVTEFAPDWIAIETPHSHHYGASRNLFGYAMVAHWVAHVRELGFVELGRSECYAACVKDGKKSTKLGGVVWARQFKPLLNGDDEADAIMVAMTAHMRRTKAEAA
jgi:Holliday junction resolvasome RuvABC endonuclease subunit